MIKHYYYINKNGDPEIKKSNRRPKHSYLVPKDEITGLYEELGWVSLEDVETTDPETDITTTVKELRVNQVLKAQILGQRAADKLAEDAAKDDEQNDINDLHDKLKAFKKNDVTDLKAIQQSLALIVRALKKINNRVLDLEE